MGEKDFAPRVPGALEQSSLYLIYAQSFTFKPKYPVLGYFVIRSQTHNVFLFLFIYLF